MGRKALVTQEQVFKAAQEMQNNGEKVNASGLLARLGGGSLTTIYKFLEEWRNNGNEIKPIIKIEMPDNIKTSMENFWEACVKEANKKIIAIQEANATQEEELKQQLNEALRLISVLEAESETDNEAIEYLKAEELKANKKIHELELNIASLNASLNSEKLRAKKAEEIAENLKNKCQVEKEALNKEKELLQKEVITKAEECATEKSKKEAVQNEIFRQCQTNEKLKTEIYELESLLNQVKAEKIKAITEKETLKAHKEAEKALALAEAQKEHNTKIEEYNKRLEKIIKGLQQTTNKVINETKATMQQPPEGETVTSEHNA